MNPFVVILISVLAVAAFLLLFSMGFTWIVLKASDRHMAKIVGKHTEATAALMPGTNCGKCGYDSCYECAKAMVCGQESTAACKEGDEDLADRLFASIVEFKQQLERPEEPKRAKKKFFSRDQ